LQGFNQSRLVYNRTPRHIDQETLRTQRLQYFGIDQVFGGSSARRDDDQVVDFGSQGRRCGYIFVRYVGARAARVVADLHVKRSRTLGDSLANAAHAHNAQPSTRQFARELERAVKPIGIAGAGLDVYLDEPNVPAELRKLDNVVLTPHIASGTVETRKAMSALALANLAAHFAGEPVKTPVPECRP